MPKKPTIIRPILPIALLLFGVCVLIGCIPIPGNFRQPNGRARPEASIGKAGSDKPIRVGESSAVQVAHNLGPFAAVSRDGCLAVYTYELNGWSTVADGCFLGSDAVRDQRYLLLRFGTDGKLRSWKTYKNRLDLNREVGTNVLVPTTSASPLTVE